MMTISGFFHGPSEEVGDCHQIIAYRGLVFVIWERI